jgi:predicted nucleic acid-binding protein
MNAVDTNVLIHAYDVRLPDQQKKAIELLDSLTDCVLLWQVACEFLAASRKLSPTGFTIDDAWGHLGDLQRVFRLVAPSPQILVRAKDFSLNQGVQFWDAMIYGACLEAGVSRFYSEDLPGRRIDGLDIINPFV